MKKIIDSVTTLFPLRLFVVLTLLAALLALSLCFLTAADEKGGTAVVPEPAHQGFDTISYDDLKSIVALLASDDFEGREADSQGERITAAFITAWLSGSGIQGWKGGNTMNDYIQMIPCVAADVDTGSSSLVLQMHRPDAEKSFALESDAYYSPQSPNSVSLSAPVVFAGYGIDAPEYGYNDYGSFDVRDKIVIVFNHEPQEKIETSIFRGAKMTRYTMPQTKARIAQERGARALVIMRDRNNPHRSMGETLAMRGSKEERGHFLGIEGAQPLIPILYIEDPVADEIFARSKIDLKETQARIDETLKSMPVLLKDVTLSLNMVMKDEKKLTLRNLIAMIEGADRTLKEEALIVGAHYDHLGMKPEGIYHGADDNATGVAALLMTSRAFEMNSARPKRSIYFVFFAAEEKGVIGSTFLSTHLPVQKERISAMLNLDELGRNNMDKEENAMMAIAFTSGQSPELKKIVQDGNAVIGLDMKYYPTLRFLTNSDHSLFHDMEIPVIFFFSGFHEDYHQTTDTAEKINYTKLEKLTQLIYLTAWEIANRDEKIRFDTSITQESEKDEFERPY